MSRHDLMIWNKDPDDVKWYDMIWYIILHIQVSNFADEIQVTTGSVNVDTKEKRKGLYSNMFFLVRSNPTYLSELIPKVSLKFIDDVLRVVMFTLYGNQFDAREEDLLLQVFKMVIEKDVNDVCHIISYHINE